MGAPGVADYHDIKFYHQVVSEQCNVLVAGDGGLDAWTGLSYVNDVGAVLDGFQENDLNCQGWTTEDGIFEGTLGRFQDKQEIIKDFRLLSQAHVNCGSNTAYIYCFLYIPKSSGGEDPHFNGFNGERLDIVHDADSTNKIFTLFCSESMTVNALFSSTVDDRLYMTEIYVLSGEDKLTVALGQSPITGERMELDHGYVVYRPQKKQTLAVSESVRVVITEAVEDDVTFLNVDVNVLHGLSVSATGILGRTLNFKLTDAEFANYKQFKTAGKFVAASECAF